jgi:crotonobetainyl-CoA:carnitine CoA-transferase CaiB-like acyl-CoA transferase
MNRSDMLRGVRVLDLSGNLAGIYAGRLLADAGAHVTRPATATADLGDPGTGYSTAAYQALERLLNAGKTPTVDVEQELREVDIVLDTGAWPRFDPFAARSSRPDLIVVSLTAYGLTGPYAGQHACSILLQAQSGSSSSRGLPEWPPLAAAGETEQFLAGAYAAAAAVAALHGREIRGTGDLIDLSLLEVSNLGQTLFGTTQASMRGRLGEDFPVRSMQIPANERTKDGWVGLCTISARQRRDLLLIIGRADLADDETNAYGNEKPGVDAEIRASVAAWTSQLTTDEVIDIASSLRIPVSPLITGESLTENEQLAARGFFHRNEEGILLPDPPFRFTATTGPESAL